MSHTLTATLKVRSLQFG